MTGLSLSPNISPIFLQFPIYISSSHSLEKLKRQRSLLWFSHKVRLITVTEYDYSLSHLFPASLSCQCTVNLPSSNYSLSSELSKHCNASMQSLKAKSHAWNLSQIATFLATNWDEGYLTLLKCNIDVEFDLANSKEPKWIFKDKSEQKDENLDRQKDNTLDSEGIHPNFNELRWINVYY